MKGRKLPIAGLAASLKREHGEKDRRILTAKTESIDKIRVRFAWKRFGSLLRLKVELFLNIEKL
jgi:hypothetical protein